MSDNPYLTERTLSVDMEVGALGGEASGAGRVASGKGVGAAEGVG